MSSVFRQLLADPTVWLAFATSAGLLHLYMRNRITKGVDHHFALKLEDHRQSLRLAAESARYDFERSLAKANLYSSRAHEAAVQVYRSLREAHGSCLNLSAARQDLTFEEFNRDDLKEHMTRYEVPKGKQDEILERLGTDRVSAIEDLKAYLRMLEVQRAERDLALAKNVSYENELYFDDDAIEAIESLFDALNRWMLFIRFPPERGEREGVPTAAEIDARLDTVHSVLREKLQGTKALAPVEQEDPA